MIQQHQFRQTARVSTTRVLGYRAAQVLGYVRTVIEIEGQAPSYSMIRDALGFGTKSDVCQVIEGLEKRGLLRRTGKGRVRRISLG